MCAIFGSDNYETFLELARLNAYRGGHSFSVSSMKDGRLTVHKKDFGPFPILDLPEADLYIGHVQAPTTEARDESSIHPAICCDSMLWHNGIIKEKQVKEWQEATGSDVAWDTQWMAFHLDKDGWDSLSEMDGSFACLWYNWYKGGLYLFRNENSPMFLSEDGLTFSSTKFENSVAIEDGKIYNFVDGFEETGATFGTKETFYWSFEG